MRCNGMNWKVLAYMTKHKTDHIIEYQLDHVTVNQAETPTLLDM